MAITIRNRGIAPVLSRSDRTLLVMYPRPKTRGACETRIRPCPYVSCRHHLYLDVNPKTGSLKLNFPHLRPDQLEESCALDVADGGPLSFPEVSELLNITKQRVHGMAFDALGRLLRRAQR